MSKRLQTARRALVAYLVLLSAGVVVADDALTPELLVDLRQVREVAAAPDGERVAYTLRTQRAEEDEPGGPYAQLWILDSDGKTRHFAGDKESISAPGWSPDGKQISFLTDRGEDGARIFSIAVDGGEAHELFEHSGSISRYAWSPDGRWIAFVARDAETDEEKEDKEAGRDWEVVDADPKFRRLWLHDVVGGETRQWFEEDLDVSAIAWTPDSAAVVFQAARTPRIDDEYMRSKIYRVALDGAPRRLTETPGKLGPMAVSSDGRSLAFLAAVSLNDPAAQSLFVVSTEGGNSRNLTEGLEGSAGDLLWLDEKTVLLVAVKGARQELYRVEVAGGKRNRLEWRGLVAQDVDKAAGSSRLVFAAHSPRHPSELFVADPDSSGPQRMSFHSRELESVSLAAQEVVEWTGPDGLKICGVLTLPLDFERGKRYPLVLQVHGGPEGVSMNGWTSSALSPVQVLAARGYAVLQPNYRGSVGRGVDFSKGDHDDLGGREFEDILAGVDTLVERGLVDGDRVGTGGWSYGGYMSAWAATRHSERFRASVVAAGLTNWIAFAGTTDIPYEMSLVHWNSWWFDEPALHWERSPLAHLDKAATPTLIVHGAADARVHPEQSLQLYTALRIKGVPTRLVLYPREPHGLNERAHQLDFIDRVVAWFDEHLMPSQQARTEAAN